MVPCTTTYTMEHQPAQLPSSRYITIKTGSHEAINAYSLVLSAVGIEHLISIHQDAVLVQETDAQAALNHLESYIAENTNWPPKFDTVWLPPHFTPQITIGLMALLAFFHWVTGSWSPDNLWFHNGAVDSRAILQHNQWWRLVTALTLHADPVHLMGNCLIGGHIILLLSRILGYGLCWSMLLTTGATGNLLNTLFRTQQHLSVGFSTAVFSAIGMVTGIHLATMGKTSLKHCILSLGAGAGLCIFLGSTDGRTDIGAHVFGFGCGLVAGGICVQLKLAQKTASQQVQQLLFLSFLILVTGCWLRAAA